MSKVAIKGAASGTATFTIESPATNTDRTLVLPDVAGTLLSNASTAGFPAGSVLQVVNSTFGTGANTNSTSSTRSDTGLSASITPSSASSKILVFVNMAACSKNSGSSSGPYLAFFLMRNSTDIIKFEGEAGFTQNTSVNSIGSVSTSYLDSPNTTSATTYKVQFSNPANAGNASFNNSAATSTITLMEIAA